MNAQTQPKTVRKSQADRARDTRTLLCRATLEVITEVGYQNTTTTLIAKRAGVSRGAQTHHFPTKHSLVCAAFEYVLQEWEQSRQSFAKAHTTAPIRLRAFVEHLWRYYFDQSHYLAVLDMLLASRGDEALRRDLAELIAQMSDQRRQLWRAALGQSVPEAELEVIMTMSSSFLRGYATQAMIEDSDTSAEDMIAMWTAFLEHRLGQGTADR